MSRLLCCVRARRTDMGAALSHPHEGEVCDGAGLPAALPTMADVIRERKKKAGGAALGTLRRRLANAARRPRDNRPDRGCEHARFIRSVVSPWRLVDVFLLCEELEAGAALRDLCTQAELAREPAPALHSALPQMYIDRWWCDVEVVGGGGAWSVCAHRAVLAARSHYFRALLNNNHSSCGRVALDGACATLTRDELDAALLSLYSGGSAATHCPHHAKYECNGHVDGDLDLVDNTGTRGGGGGGAECACAARGAAARRALQLLAITRDPLATTMRYLLDSGEMSDATLVFRLEGGCGAQYGFRSALELPAHRVLLAARSRFFRSVMSRRGAGGAGGAVCVDEKVLPRRFARALLHAAYTDQVDLSLIGRNTTLPTTSSNSNSTPWSGVSRGGSSRLTTAMLEDAFQLYEIARFLEMPIVVQGCEDAIAEALSPDTLPLVLRWSSAPHASHWVHRQAMRYLRDEFVTILSSAGSSSIPGAALSTALASPFLQASEVGALRAVLKWAHDHKHRQREPNVVWHSAHSVSRRRRELSDTALRDILAPLVQHIRTEHIPPDNELLQQLVRRGVVPAPAAAGGEEGAGGGSAHAWLGRGSCRPARCFLPYLDEIKALLEEQPVPEAELARARRARYMHRIPDTLYMVAAGRSSPGPPSPPPAAPGALVAARACVCARTAAALRARARELRAAPAARRLLRRHRHHRDHVDRQIALRAVREMSLPDTCAELLLQDMDDIEAGSMCSGESSPAPAGGERDLGAGAAPAPAPAAWSHPPDCCRTGSLRCDSTNSLRALELSNDTSRGGSCGRRDHPPRPDSVHHPRSASGSWSRGAGAGAGAAAAAGGRLSAAVPDVAMAPNANTHLLTARDYFRHPPPWEYGGVVLQLDLGDGATHTPRPGSRAQRNTTAQHSARQHAPVAQAISCLRARADEDELRAAIELSVMRAYSSFQCRGRDGGVTSRSLPAAPAPAPAPRADLPAPTHAPDRHAAGVSPRTRGSRSARSDPAQLLPVARASPSPSPRRRDYRLESGAYSGSGGSSRGHSPNNYA